MKSFRARLGLMFTFGLLVAAGCKGATNDDKNFIVLTARASLDAGGLQATGPSNGSDITPDGRFVVFASRAPDLVPDDSNGKIDIFRKDLQSGEIVRASVEHPSDPDGLSDGLNTNTDSFSPAISADGRFIVFVSGDQGAGDIVLGDTNFAQDVFVADLLNPAGIVTVRVSIEHASDPDGDGDPDRNANGNSSNPDISDDGRYIVFDSSANDLVVADFGTFIDDVFAFDREFFIMTRVSVSTTGTPGNQGSFNPTISGDGLVVAFQSQADNLDSNPDTNNQQDIFIKSWLLPTPTTERVSLPDDSLLPLVTEGDGFCFNPSISRDGRFVAFSTNAKNLIAGDNNDTSDIYVRDRALGTTTRASVSFQGTEALEGAFQGSISADGRFVVFDSFSPNLVLGDTNNAGDVFVRDTVSGTTVRASVATYGVETSPFFSSFGGSISGDGRFVSFESSAANLTANDTNGVSDIFIRGPLY